MSNTVHRGCALCVVVSAISVCWWVIQEKGKIVVMCVCSAWLHCVCVLSSVCVCCVLFLAGNEGAGKWEFWVRVCVRNCCAVCVCAGVCPCVWNQRCDVCVCVVYLLRMEIRIQGKG